MLTHGDMAAFHAAKFQFIKQKMRENKSMILDISRHTQYDRPR